MFKFSKLSLGCVAGLILSASAIAQNGTQNEAQDVVPVTHVVELFTSQGCSSCPPANRFVGKLADDPSMLVLSYGVTYWDYLGWKDTFGDPAFTRRQKDYQMSLGTMNVYTPQIIIGGAEHGSRFSKKKVEALALPEGRVDLDISLSDGALVVKADAPSNAILDIVSFTPGEQTIDVRRGENRGRTLTLTNVVTQVSTPKWDGKSAHFEMPDGVDQAYAVLIHDGETAHILGAEVVFPQ